MDLGGRGRPMRPLEQEAKARLDASGLPRTSYRSDGSTVAKAVTIADFGDRRTGWGDRRQGPPSSDLATGEPWPG